MLETKQKQEYTILVKTNFPYMFDFLFKPAVELNKKIEEEAKKQGFATNLGIMTEIKNELTAIRQNLESINRKLDK